MSKWLTRYYVQMNQEKKHVKCVNIMRIMRENIIGVHMAVCVIFALKTELYANIMRTRITIKECVINKGNIHDGFTYFHNNYDSYRRFFYWWRNPRMAIG